MQIVTIRDLESASAEDKAEALTHILRIQNTWTSWKRQFDGDMDLLVTFRGERTRKPGLHASELSGCRRKLVLALRGAKRHVDKANKDVNMQRRFDVGTMVHALLQAEIHLMVAWFNTRADHDGVTLEFEDEVKIDRHLGGPAAKYDMESSTDGILTFLRDGIPFLRLVLEIKTASDKEYEKLKAPKEDHREQTCMYMTALDAPYCWTLYYNKSNSNMTQTAPPWVTSYDFTLWEKVLVPRIEQSLQDADDHLKPLPDREEGMPCGWCPFGQECKPAYLNRGGVAAAPTMAGRRLI